MISNYCVDINIPVSHPLKDPSVLNQDGISPDIWFEDVSNVSDEFKLWLSDNNLILTYPPLIFYTPPRRECGIHIDGDSIVDRVVMNWIVQGSGSEMLWYKLAPGVEITENVTTQAGTPYTRYKEEDVIHLHSQPVKWPSIVQTGIPHKITNYCDEPRWCISCDISSKDNPELGMTMKEALEIYKQWLS